jgi:hypothetical protein
MADKPSWLKKALSHPDVLGAGAKKRKRLSPERGKAAVMAEYERGTLRSGGSGEHVKSHKQAYAIAMSETKRKGA